MQFEIVFTFSLYYVGVNSPSQALEIFSTFFFSPSWRHGSKLNYQLIFNIPKLVALFMKICRFLGTKMVISKYYLSKTSDNTDAMATTENEDSSLFISPNVLKFCWNKFERCSNDALTCLEVQELLWTWSLIEKCLKINSSKNVIALDSPKWSHRELTGWVDNAVY